MTGRYTILTILILALVAGAAWTLLPHNIADATTSRSAARLQITAQPSLTPAKTPQSALEVVGTFTAPRRATLAFTTGGRIKNIPVHEGETVKQGDVMTQLDARDLALNVTQAQAGLTLAQARFDQAKAGGTQADVSAAQAALQAAGANYAKVAAGPTKDDLQQAAVGVDNAQAALSQAQAAYDQVKGSPNIGMLPQSLALQQATNNYNAAAAAFNSLKSHPTATELQQAAAQVAQAQDALARLQPTAQDLAVAQAQVDQAQAALNLASQQLADATLTAPISGTVTWIGPRAGDLAAPDSPIMIVADLADLQFQAGVDENVLGLVKVGQTALISPSEFPGQVIRGTVSRIDAMATTTDGVVNVPVIIDVAANNLPMRPGLTGTAEIQIHTTASHATEGPLEANHQ